MKRFARCFWVLWLFCGLSLDPAGADSSIRFERFGYEQGLASDVVGATIQDHVGYVWVGTTAGLQRFDGHQFETFLEDSGLPGLDVEVLLEDRWGRLWVGTTRGVAFFRRETKSFQTLDLPTTESPGVRSLLEDRGGDLWIGTGAGVFRLPLANREPKAEEVRSGFADLIDPDRPTGHLDPRFNAMAEDQAGNLWFGTRGGLLRLAPGEPYRRLDVLTHDEQIPWSLHDDEIYALLNDDQGDLWIGAWGGHGLARLPADQLSSDRPRFSRFEYPEDDLRGLGTEVVKALFQDQKGNLWIGTQHDGARWLSPRERRKAEPRFRRLIHDPLDPTSLPNGAVLNLSGDALGGVWVGTVLGGLARHEPATAAVASLFPFLRRAESTKSMWVRDVYQSRDGTIWAATAGGLDRIREPEEEGGDFRIESFRHDPSDPSSLSSDNVYAVLEDEDGRIWAATALGGLHRLEDSESDRFVRFGADHGIGSDTAFALLQDSHGTLWLGTYQGIYRSLGDLEEPRFEKFVAPGEVDLSSEVVYGLLEDRRGRLWIETDHGLYSLDESGAALTVPLPDLRVSQMTEGADGSLWAATEYQGIIRIDPETVEWISVTASAGMPKDDYQGVVIDGSGRIWFTSIRRLYRYDPSTESVRSFGGQDGFLIGSFLPGSLHVGREGDIFVGGNQGLIRFRPQDLKVPPLTSQVELRQLYLANKPVAVGSDGPLDGAIESIETLELKPEHRIFSIEFAALAFHRQNLVRYAYRLVGFSDEWTETDMDHRLATYTRLSPGRYSFEVRAKNDVGSWTPEPTRLDIVVLPRWYQTTGFRVVVPAVLIGLPLLLLWLRIRRLNAHRRQLQALVDRWQLERRERERLQDLSVDASRVVSRTREPLIQIHRRARKLLGSETVSETRDDLQRISDYANQAISRLGAFFSVLRGEEPSLMSVDLGAVIDEILDSFGLEAQETSHGIQQGVHGVEILADEALLAQMLFHLISDRVRHRAGMGFLFLAEGSEGRLRIQDGDAPRGPSITISQERKEPDLAAAERLAEQQRWSVVYRRNPGRELTIEISGLRWTSGSITAT